MKRLLFLTLASVLVGLIIAELLARAYFALLGIENNYETRPWEPYFVSGDFYGTNNGQSGTSLGSLEKSREGPASYGYKTDYLGLYIYDDYRRTLDAGRRSDFLFDHYLSRYSAEEVDQILDEQPCAITIMVIGGSAAQGSSASSKDTAWHAVLEHKLRKDFGRDDIYIFNAAMGAFVSGQERVAYDLAVAPRKPDLVIDFNGFNDIFIPLYSAVAPGDPLQTGTRYGQIYGSQWLHLLSSQSALFRFLQVKSIYNYLGNHKQAILEEKSLSDDLAKNISRVYAENMSYLISRGKESASETIVVLQPWRSLSAAQANGTWGTEKLSSDDDASFAFSVYSLIKSSLKSEESKGDFVDLSDILSSKDMIQFYTDTVHTDDRGQIAIANKMESFVKPRVKILLSDRATQNCR